MKRMISTLMISAALVCSFTVTSPAADALVIDWSEYEQEIAAADEEIQAAWDGEFVEMDEISMKIYIPSSFEQLELTDEDYEDGYIAYFTKDDAFSIGVQYIDADSMSLEDYKEYLESVEIEAADVELNGIPCIFYVYEDEDNAATTHVISFATEMGYILEVAMGSIEDDATAAAAEVIMASIQES